MGSAHCAARISESERDGTVHQNKRSEGRYYQMVIHSGDN